MAAENILGKLIIEGANRAGSIAGGAPSLGSGLAGGGGGTSTRSAEMETRGFQKTVKDAQVKAVGFAKEQPKWWTRMFKTLGIQMGLAGILKQSQVFTSTIGAMFQIFGAMVDVMLVPLVKPVLMPLMRWLARQIPTMGRLSKAVFGFLGSTIMAIMRMGKKMVEWGKDTYDWLKDKGTSIWNGMKNLGSLDWWTKNVLSPTWAFITDLPGNIYTEIAKLFKWSTWETIFRSLWGATLGGVKVGKGQFSFTFPTWTGGSTFEMEGIKTPGNKEPTLVTRDSDGNILSYESTSGIERGFKTGFDKEGNVLEEKYGRNSEKTGKVLLGVWEWMKNTKEGDAPRTLSGYEKYKEGWLGSRAKDREGSKIGNVTEVVMGEADEIKDWLVDLDVKIKASLLGSGVVLSAMYMKDMLDLMKNMTGRLTRGVLTPFRAVKGILDGLMSQIKIGDQKSFVKHFREGKGVTGSLKAALSNFQFGFQPKVLATVADDLPTALPTNDVLRNFRESTSKLNKVVINQGDDLAELGKSRSSKIATATKTALAKAGKALLELTSWMVNQLRNLKNLLSANAFAQAEKHLATKTDEIMGFLKGIPRGAAVSNIIGRLALLKSFLARAIPLVGAAVGAVMTAKNIRTILGTDLSWFTANENSLTAIKDNAQIMASLAHVSDATREGNELIAAGGAENVSKGVFAHIAAGFKGRTADQQASLGFKSHTKAGAILNQLILGSVTTGTGLFGAAGLPAGTQSAIAQELAMGDVRNNSESIEFYNQMLLAARAGVHGVGNELNIKLDGMDAVMDIPGY